MEDIINRKKQLSIHSLSLQLGEFKLQDINLECKKGEYHVLVGPSGSGKTSLLKSILGFYNVDYGKIFIDGKDITNSPPEIRKIGYIPQNYALFPFLNVIENILFGSRKNGLNKHESDKLASKIISILSIQQLLKRPVQNLSGGEKQKVTFARAIVSNPDTILLDEPFSSIDQAGKKMLWFELQQAVEEIGITAIHITHDMEEAEVLGEKLSVMIDGKIVQNGIASDIFRSPINVDVAKFLDYRNIFKGITKNHKNSSGEIIGSYFDMNYFKIYPNKKYNENQSFMICIRQQDIKIIKKGVKIKKSLELNLFQGIIKKLFTFTDFNLLWFKINGSDKLFDFEIKFPRYIKERQQLVEGKAIQVAFLQPQIIVFPKPKI